MLNEPLYILTNYVNRFYNKTFECSYLTMFDSETRLF